MLFLNKYEVTKLKLILKEYFKLFQYSTAGHCCHCVTCHVNYPQLTPLLGAWENTALTQKINILKNVMNFTNLFRRKKQIFPLCGCPILDWYHILQLYSSLLTRLFSSPKHKQREYVTDAHNFLLLHRIVNLLKLSVKQSSQTSHVYERSVSFRVRKLSFPVKGRTCNLTVSSYSRNCYHVVSFCCSVTPSSFLSHNAQVYSTQTYLYVFRSYVYTSMVQSWQLLFLTRCSRSFLGLTQCMPPVCSFSTLNFAIFKMDGSCR